MATFEDIIKKHPLVLVDFSATWCGPCQMLAPILEQLKAHFKTDISIVKIDVDKNKALATKYNVQGVPTMLLFRGGTQVWRQSGVLDLKQLIAIVAQHQK